VVASLVDKSLVRQADGPGGEPRFTMLETIHEYAVEQLEASGEAAEIRRRHAEYVAQLAAEAEPAIQADSQGQWAERLEAEHDNVRAALAWSDADEQARHLLPKLANPLWMFWWQHGHWAEGRRWYDRVLETATEPAARLGALRGRGQLALQSGDLEWATRCWDEGVALARAVGDRFMLSAALGRWAYTAGQMGDAEQARALADESLAVARETGDPRRVASAYWDVGQAARARGDLRAARLAWEECLRRGREHGVAFMVPYALQQLSFVAVEEGDLERATELAEASLPLFQQRNDRWGLLGSISRLIRVAQVRGDRARAATLARENLILARALGSLTAIAEHLVSLAWVARVDGDLERATRLLGAADALFEATGRRISAAARQEIEAETATLRQALGELSFVTAWNEGRSLSADRAAAYALGETGLD
jgi:tetratricopeptide (TPR) repeat protein